MAAWSFQRVNSGLYRTPGYSACCLVVLVASSLIKDQLVILRNCLALWRRITGKVSPDGCGLAPAEGKFVWQICRDLCVQCLAASALRHASEQLLVLVIR